MCTVSFPLIVHLIRSSFFDVAVHDFGLFEATYSSYAWPSEAPEAENGDRRLISCSVMRRPQWSAYPKQNNWVARLWTAFVLFMVYPDWLHNKHLSVVIPTDWIHTQFGRKCFLSCHLLPRFGGSTIFRHSIQDLGISSGHGWGSGSGDTWLHCEGGAPW